MVLAVRLVVGLVIAALGVAGARVARVAARDEAGETGALAEAPFAPSAAAAPYVALGYREAAADLLYVRLVGYFNGETSTGDGVADLAEAVVALDPHFKRVYEVGANAMTLAKLGVTQAVLQRAATLLEQGTKMFPQEWRLSFLAGQIYTQDLTSDDPVKKRELDEKGVLLIESAIRKPGAPANAAAWAAVMRTKLGQHERAVQNLREMLLVTDNPSARKRMIDQLARLEEKDSAAVALEVYEERNQFLKRWRAERSTVPATLYVLLGARIRPGFDLVDLATGGRDVTIPPPPEPLEPLE